MTRTSKIIERYHRPITLGREDSLAKIVQAITPGTTVLDVGAAAGALGAFLAAEAGCIVDGVEIDVAAAASAATSYRRMVVADLNVTGLTTLFPARTYDYVVFADVLEHLQDPFEVLRQSRDLLNDQGRFLLSVPNIAYAPVVAELLWGRFTYRSAGILDESHTKFFTRTSLLDLVSRSGLQAVKVGRVVKPPHESEFDTRFLEALPQAVRAFVRSQEEATTYQFIVEALPVERVQASGPPEPGKRSSEPVPRRWPLPLQFLSKLCWRFPDLDYRPDDCVHTLGKVGQGHQTLSFRWPDLPKHPAALRLEICDRPAILSLLRIEIASAEGSVIWRWDGDPAVIEAAPKEGLMVAPGKPDKGVVLALSPHGAVLELPVEELVLRRCQEGGRLDATIDWPQTPDYMVLASKLEGRFDELAAAQKRAQEMVLARDALVELLDRRLELLRHAEEQVVELTQERERLARLLEERLELLRQTERERDQAGEERDRLQTLLAELKGRVG